MPVRSVVACTLLLLACSVAFAADKDVELSGAEKQRALTELPVFKNKGPITARIICEVDDLLGARKDEGELLLDRSGRVLRKFTRPSLKIWLLSGSQIQEYAAARKTVYVKDFSQAPNVLKLIQSAFTGDLKGLESMFELQVFRGGAENAPSYRFVMTRKASVENAQLYKRIELLAHENALFFHQIEYTPESGDKTTERYLDIKAAETISDKDFTLDLPQDIQRKTENIRDK